MYGVFCVALTDCFLEYNSTFMDLVIKRLLTPGGLPKGTKFKLANGDLVSNKFSCKINYI